MKIKTLVSAVTLGAATILTSSPALAVDASSVTVVDGYQYDATSLLSHTVCLGDVEVKRGSTAILSTVSIAPGTYTLAVADSDVECGDNETMWYTAEVNVADVAAQSIGFGWPSSGNELRTSELPTWQGSNEFGCVENGQGRVVLRNYTSVDPDYSNLTIGSRSSGGEYTPLISYIFLGQDSAPVSPPSYPGADSGETFAGWLEDSMGDDIDTGIDQLPVAANSTTVVYAYGGGDGSIGIVTQQFANADCDETTTTSTSTTTTSTTSTTTTLPASTTSTLPGREYVAPVATPVSASPTYTG